MVDRVIQACFNTWMIATKDVIKHFESVAAVAAFFDIEVQAVYQWQRHVPELRELQLRQRLPGVFQIDRERSAA